LAEPEKATKYTSVVFSHADGRYHIVESWNGLAGGTNRNGGPRRGRRT
jgi:hypothetical protein